MGEGRARKGSARARANRGALIFSPLVAAVRSSSVVCHEPARALLLLARDDEELRVIVCIARERTCFHDTRRPALALVIELFPEGSVERYVPNSKPGAKASLKVCTDMALAIEYLRSPSV